MDSLVAPINEDIDKLVKLGKIVYDYFTSPKLAEISISDIPFDSLTCEGCIKNTYFLLIKISLDTFSSSSTCYYVYTNIIIRSLKLYMLRIDKRLTPAHEELYNISQLVRELDQYFNPMQIIT
jgi:hypothetical protein